MVAVFRNEGVDSNGIAPNLPTLECYEAYADQYVMAERMQEIIVACAQELGVTAIETEDGTIDLGGEWAWLSVYPGLSKAVGVEINPGHPPLRRCARLPPSMRLRWIPPGMLRSL